MRMPGTQPMRERETKKERERQRETKKERERQDKLKWVDHRERD